MIKVESVQFSQPVLVDKSDPRAGFKPDEKTEIFYDERTGYVVFQGLSEWSVAVPPAGSVIRGVGKFAGASQTGVVANGQQPTAGADSPPPARPIAKSGRVQR